MQETANIKLYAFTLDAPDHRALAAFYAELLGWAVAFADEEFASVGPVGAQQGAYPGLTFQRNPDYVPPVWPDAPGAQQQLAHLDFAVDDVEAAAAHATRCGATVAAAQFSEHWRVMLDPAGHPFCLCAMGALMESEGFALR